MAIGRDITTPPIRGLRSHSIVMHEIGHILGRYQESRRCLVRENWAWVWARRNALIWTSAMECSAQSDLDWYQRHAAKIDAKWRSPEWVE